MHSLLPLSWENLQAVCITTTDAILNVKYSQAYEHMPLVAGSLRLGRYQ